ncbi:MAG: signal peptidase II [Clostridia bacterium]|nr:signal peptidase II [Clostridia bacterium]NCC68738.1 signal peptidase II [Clostridia bacterium]
MLYAIVALLVLVLDQAVKYWATISITFNEGSVTLIPGVISLVNIHNYGAAFGFLQSQNARWLFVIVAIIFVAVVILALGKNYIREPLGRWSAILVMAGAVGNCIDRVMNGYVVDMFQFQFINFAVFNVADIFITVCGILFCVYIIFSDEFKGKDPAQPRERKSFIGKKDPLPEAKAPQVPAAADENDVRAYVPKTPRPAKNEPAPEKPDLLVFKAPVVKPEMDPFAEWEALPPLDVRPEHAPDAVISSSIISEEAVSEAPPMSKPKKTETEFNLEDILAEYSSK